MPIDPEKSLEVGGWLTKARTDLEAGEHLLSADPPFTASAAFHAQQAAEKSLKAFLSWHDLPFRKTHDLSEIGQQCVDVDASLEDTCRRAEPLTIYAWIFRYPGDAEGPSVDEARSSLRVAREVHAAVLERLPSQLSQ